MYSTRKMILKAPIVQILKAERPVCLASKNLFSIEHMEPVLRFIAITNKSNNVWMLKRLKVIILLLKLLIVKFYIEITKFLDSNLFSIFLHSLLKHLASFPVERDLCFHYLLEVYKQCLCFVCRHIIGSAAKGAS